jgi:hypothetical protein
VKLAQSIPGEFLTKVVAIGKAVAAGLKALLRETRCAATSISTAAGD